MSVQNFSFIAALEVAEKFGVVVGWVGFKLLMCLVSLEMLRVELS